MNLKRISSTGSPLSLAEFKLQLGMNWDDEDDVVEHYLSTAVESIEKATGLSLAPTVWQESFFDFPREEICLEKRPATEAEITYLDSEGEEVELDPDTYIVVASDYLPSYLYPLTYWPTLSYSFPRPDRVRVEYTAGGISQHLAVQAVLLVGTTWYRNRSSELVGTISTELKHGLDRLLGQLAPWRFAR